MTDADFLAWLKDPSALRVVLIEARAQVAGVETTFYMSTKGGYTTGAAEVPANEIYHAIASVGVLYTEQISLTGSASLSAGDIEVENYNGARDNWTGYVWTNRQLQAWIGDPRWPRADFRMIFNGIIADIAPRGRNALSLKLRDKLQRLNTPATDAKLGGTTPNKDAILPLAFGECHNVTPLLVDPATLAYQVHAGPVEGIFEVRDNGVPVPATTNNAAGTFTLAAQPFGTVTVSVQGDKPSVYSNTAAKLVERLVTGYGKAADRFTAGDLDSANLAAFDAANPQPMGIPLPDRTNVLTACQALAGSVGAQLSMTRLGKLRLIRLALPAVGTPTEVHPKHMVERTLAPVERTEVVGAVRLSFNKNWTVQDNLVTGIPEGHKDLYATEWLTSTKTDAAVQATYKLAGDPVQQDTMLLRRTDADAEAQRRLDMWKVPRTVYEFEGVPELLTLELGQAIKVFHPRFGMAAGVTGMVISLAPDWLNGHVKVGFIV